MTKKELFEAALKLCAKHNAPEAVVTGLTELLEPKKGGQVVDIESIVRRDAEGNIVELECQTSKVWLPADLLNFTPAKGSKIVNAEGEELYKISRAAQKAKSEAAKVFKSSKEAITNDVLDGVISPTDGKAAIEGLSQEVDYSVVVPVYPPVEEA